MMILTEELYKHAVILQEYEKFLYSLIWWELHVHVHVLSFAWLKKVFYSQIVFTEQFHFSFSSFWHLYTSHWAVWRCQEEVLVEIGVWEPDQVWSSDLTILQILPEATGICTLEICLLCLLQVQKGEWNKNVAPIWGECSCLLQAYYGGEAHCAEAANAGDDYDPTELVCPACSHTGGQVQVAKHCTVHVHMYMYKAIPTYVSYCLYLFHC